MPSFKAVIIPGFVKANGMANIKIRVCHKEVGQKSKVRYISTPWEIEPDAIDKHGLIKASHPLHSNYNKALLSLISEYNKASLDQGMDIYFMDINKLVAKLKKGKQPDFIEYVTQHAKWLKTEKRYSSAGVYNSILTNLKDFTGKEVISFAEINTVFLADFAEYLLKIRKVHNNTALEYLTKINVAINHAVREEVVKASDLPVRKVDLKEIRPIVRQMDMNDLRKLMTGPYPKVIQRAVDVFMLSFYLIGMNIQDICYLQDEDIYKGRILYQRLKTKGPVSVKILPEAQHIIDKYKGKRYLLSFLDKNDSFTAFKSFAIRANKGIREAGKINGIPLHLTTYFARRTWGTLASDLISDELIDKALGHGLKSLIRRYVKLDLEKIDEANKKLISAVLGGGV